MITRARLAGVTMLMTGATMPVAEELPRLHMASTAILLIGGTLLTLVSDKRCQPKLDRLTTTLLRRLDRRITQHPTMHRRRHTDPKQEHPHGKG